MSSDSSFSAMLAKGDAFFVEGRLNAAMIAYERASNATGVVAEEAAAASARRALVLARLGLAKEAVVAAPLAPAAGDCLGWQARARALAAARQWSSAEVAASAALAAAQTATPAEPALCAELTTLVKDCADARAREAAASAEAPEGAPAPTAGAPEHAHTVAPDCALGLATAATAATPALRHDWHQTPDTLRVVFYLRGADDVSSRVTVGGSGSRLAVSLVPRDEAGATGSAHCADLRLHGRVDADSYSVSYGKTKVEVRMTKASGYEGAWPALVAAPAGAPKATPAHGDAGASALAPASAAAAAAAQVSGGVSGAGAGAGAGARTGTGAPLPSAYAGKKDWRHIEKQLEEEEKAEPAPEGQEALQKLFQSIYAGGDEATRRAMNKSFQMSGGTVLSTNWKDVEKRDFEADLKAPDGAEVRKF